MSVAVDKWWCHVKKVLVCRVLPVVDVITAGDPGVLQHVVYTVMMIFFETQAVL